MKGAYIAPELKMAGKAGEVVLGMAHIGADFFSEFVDAGGGEFQQDVQADLPGDR